MTPPNSPPDEDRDPTGSTVQDGHRSRIQALCDVAFGPAVVEPGTITDVNRGRGAFSVVLRAELSPTKPAAETANHGANAGVGPEADDARADDGVPATVVAKLPVAGANGAAAVSGGAYRREALAYRSILVDAPVRTPEAYAVDEPGDGTCSLLLEDLSRYRAADQLDGLGATDALTVAGALRTLHRAWDQPPRLTLLDVRRNTIAGLSIDGLRAGLTALGERWEPHLSAEQRACFADLVAASPGLVSRFAAEPQTLCHGDPRADNLVFDDRSDPADGPNGRVILFDWQQLAVQFGEADLAWLGATSLELETRRRLDRELVTAYGGDLDRYRLGFALPGLAVLMLAQRHFPTERARRFVSVSLQRIAAAIDDLDVAALA